MLEARKQLLKQQLDRVIVQKKEEKEDKEYVEPVENNSKG